MPTTGVINTKLMRIYIGSNAITCQTDANLNVTNATRETTCKDSGQWKEFLYGQTEWEITGEALASFDATQGIDELSTLVLAQTSSAVVFQTAVTGDTKWSGTVVWTNFTISSPGINENVTISFTGKGSGSLTQATVA